jgi:RNA polymerase sigma-70 factor (ECF subfamily)
MSAYQDMVYSTTARLLGDEAQAEDIAQEVFLKAYENFEQLRGSPTIGGWLKTVATNLSLNHLTRHRKRWRVFSDFQRQSDTDDEPESGFPESAFAVPDTLLDDLLADERHRSVESALKALPEHQRVPLVLYHFEDLSYQDIAQRLRVSLAKVKTDILRGRMSLAQLLIRSGRPGGDLTLGASPR